MPSCVSFSTMSSALKKASSSSTVSVPESSTSAWWKQVLRKAMARSLMSFSLIFFDFRKSATSQQYRRGAGGGLREVGRDPKGVGTRSHRPEPDRVLSSVTSRADFIGPDRTHLQILVVKN